MSSFALSKPLFGLLIVFVAQGCLLAQEPATALADEVQRLLAERCARCHGTELNKPKGGFGRIEDLAGLVGDGFVTAGKPTESDLVLILDDPDAPMPPRDAPEAPLDFRERALLHYWIATGAPAPKAAMPAAPDGTVTVAPAPVAEPERGFGFWMRLGGSLHVVLVHLPVALLALAVVAEFLGGDRHPRVRAALVRFCLGFGALSALAAGGSGWIAAHTEGYAMASVHWHRWTGIAAAGLGFLLFFAHEFVDRRPTASRWPLRIALILLALLISWTGHLGGVLVHQADHFPF